MSKKVKKDSLRMKINGYNYGEVDQKEALKVILKEMFPHMKYMSLEAMKDWMKNALSLIEDTLEWEKNIPLRIRIKNAYEMIDLKIQKREDMMIYVSNFVLNLEGLNIFTRNN